MKKLYSILVFIIFNTSITPAQPTNASLFPKVDHRMELLSIVFKLAKPKLFSDTVNISYSLSIKNHFKQYSNHALIKFVEKLPDSLAYWEMPSLAVHISDAPNLFPLVPYNEEVAVDIWDNRTLLNIQFLGLLSDFYKEAHCDDFFKLQEKYFEKLFKYFETSGKKLNTNWVSHFFGTVQTEQYYPILGLLGIGNWNYMRVNFPIKNRYTFTLFSPQKFDENGFPIGFSIQNMLRSSLHEYIHTFGNQVVDKNMKALQKPAAKLLKTPKVWEKVKPTFFNNEQYLMYESIVRAVAIKYMVKHPEIETTREKEIATQEKSGFFWMRDLLNHLDNYEKNRGKYPNFETYMPELVIHFEKIADELK